MHVVWYSLLPAASLSSFAAWLWLLVFRGGFWRATRDAHLGPPAEGRRRVEVVVPARDEAANVGPAVMSLLSQDYGGPLHVTLVDDRSSDGTSLRAAEGAAASPHPERLSIVEAARLEPGWSGKLNALESGIRSARASRPAPDFWLFTDADIVHEPATVGELVAKAERDRLELVSLMVRLRCETGWERLLIPAFVFFFQKLYPFAWSNDPRKGTAAAAGGCVLLSDSALERIGGIAAIKGALIDDCSLAAAVKRSGGTIWLGLTDRSRSIRPYEGIGELWGMVKRSAFTQLGHSYPMLALTIAGMLFLYVVPPLATVAGIVRRDRLTALSGAGAWLLMSLAYLPTLRAYRRPPASAATLPLAAVLYTAMTVDSALAHLRKRGGRWKGRTYEAASPVAGA
jgi:hopene-associated glycosyltransferase HpnB